MLSQVDNFSFKNIILFSMQEADLGFALVIDRRNDKWSSVKITLLKISVSQVLL